MYTDHVRVLNTECHWYVSQYNKKTNTVDTGGVRRKLLLITWKIYWFWVAHSRVETPNLLLPYMLHSVHHLQARYLAVCHAAPFVHWNLFKAMAAFQWLNTHHLTRIGAYAIIAKHVRGTCHCHCFISTAGSGKSM